MPPLEIGKQNFKIVRLAEGDVRCKTDHLSCFEDMVLANQRMYPTIEGWFRDKVIPGIRYSERVAFIGYLDEKPVVSAIVKKGDQAKFCHLRISESLQGTNLGEVFFSVMALEIRDLAKGIYFTLPESLWQHKGPFFQSFGFSSASSADTQYRLFDRELQCSARFPLVWKAVLEKIPKLAHLYGFGGFSPDNQLLLSVRAEFAEKILNRKKTVEVRRKFSTRWLGHRINLYASAPVMSLVGEAKICGIVVQDPETIWERFHGQIGCSRAEFDRYTKDAHEIYAIELDEIKPYRDRFPLVQISALLKENLIPPQSYLTMERNKPWAKAISLAAYLHGCFKSTISFALEAGSVGLPQKTTRVHSQSLPRQTQSELNLV